MGTFELDSDQHVVFRPTGEANVFLSYAQEDRALVSKLYQQLKNAGLEPWMDCRKLLPGQNWPRAIQQTIEISDFFVACFSQNSTRKRGHFQGEVALGLEVASQFPEDDVFILPVRLDECELPRRIASATQYLDLFPDWDCGVKRLISALLHHHSCRQQRERC
jgi:hypothetical protein